MKVLLLTLLFSCYFANDTLTLTLDGTKTIVNTDNNVMEMKVFTDCNQTYLYGTLYMSCTQLLKDTRFYCTSSLLSTTSGIMSSGIYERGSAISYNDFTILGGHGFHQGIVGKLSIKEVQDPDNSLISKYVKMI